MPRLTPNFPAHASRDVWQDGWLSPRRSLFRWTQPGAAAHDRTPALPRSTRDGGAGGRGNGLGADQGGALPRRAALCDEGGARAGLGAAPAARASVRPPRAGPDPVARSRGRGGSSADGAAEAGVPGAALRVGRAPPARLLEPQKGSQQPLGRPRGRRGTPVRRRVGAAGGGAGAADRRGGERGESEGAWRRGGSRSRSWPLLASDRAPLPVLHGTGGDGVRAARRGPRRRRSGGL